MKGDKNERKEGKTVREKREEAVAWPYFSN